MKRIVAIPLVDNDTLLVEVSEPDATPVDVDTTGDVPPVVRAGRAEELPARVGATVQGAIERVTPTISIAFGKIRAAIPDADTFEVEFGIKLNAKADAIIASSTAEAHFTVKVGWKSRD